jgi:hypothetical protein
MHWPSSPARDNDLQHPHPEPLHHFQSSLFHGHVLEEVSRFFILSKYRRKIGDSKYVQGVVILSPESTVWAPQQVSAHQPSSSWSPLAMPHSKPSATNRNFRRAKSSRLLPFPQPRFLTATGRHALACHAPHRYACILVSAIRCFANSFNDNAAVPRPARGNSRQRRGHLVRFLFLDTSPTSIGGEHW